MNKRGQTLVEVLIAIALLGIMASGIYVALNMSLEATGDIDQRTIAESLTRSELEYIKDHTYAYWQYDPETGNSTPPDYGDPNGRIPDVFRDHFTIAIAVVPIDPITHELLFNPEPPYEPMVEPPEQDAGMQQITVSVYMPTEGELTTECYRVAR